VTPTPLPRPLRRRVVAWLAAACLLPLRALGFERNPGFVPTSIDAALAAAGMDGAIESEAIVLKAPDVAENSAIVHVEITSTLPDTEFIYLFAEKNPQPMVAEFRRLPGMDPFVAVRIKMAESAHLRAVVRAGGRFYYRRQETRVTLGGCAG
jgi:sulfur-oxidizing protein SoxY